MVRRTVTGLVAGVMAVSVVSQLAPVKQADAAAVTKVKATATLPTLKTISFGKKSYFKINSINLMPSSGTTTGKTLYFTVTVHNGESKDLSFLDYWVKVSTTSGAIVKAKQLQSEDKAKNYIPAGSDAVFTFYATVTNSTAIENLKFNFVQFDFSVKGYERSLGTVTVPKGYTSSIQLNKSGTLSIDGEPINLTVKKLSKQAGLDYNYFTVQLNAKNAGRKSLTLPAYKYYIRTANNLLYPLYPDKNSNKPTIDAQDQMTLELSSKIPSNVSLTNSEIVITLNDETAKMELPLGSFKLPTSTLESVDQTPFKQPYNLLIDKIPASLAVTRASIDNGTQKKVKIMVQWANNGNESIELPAYTYMLRTKDNVLIPLTPDKTETETQKINIIPRWTQDLTLTTPVAETLDLTDATLVLYKTLTYGTEGATTDVKVPAAKFTLPSLQGLTGYVSPGTVTKYETNTSNFEVVVDNVSRLPWTDDDQLSASVKLTNKGTTTTAIPELLSNITLDGYSIKTDQIRMIKDTQAINLQPNESVTFYLIAKIPYVQQVKQIAIDVQAKDQDSTSDITHVAETMANIQTATPSANVEWTIAQAGKSFGAKIVSKKLLTGSFSKVAQVQVELQNNSFRYSTPPALTGWLVSKDGFYFRLTASKLETAISPTGKALVTLQGIIPKNVDLTDAQFIAGQAVTATAFATDPTAADGVVETESFALNSVAAATLQTSLNNLSLTPYTLTIDKIKPTFPGGSLANGIDLNFRSILNSTTGSYEMSAQTTTLYVELESSGYSFGVKVPLETGTGAIGLGEKNKTLSITDEDVTSKIQLNNSVTLNIYEVVDMPNGQSYKNKIATRTLKWLVENN